MDKSYILFILQEGREEEDEEEEVEVSLKLLLLYGRRRLALHLMSFDMDEKLSEVDCHTL